MPQKMIVERLRVSRVENLSQDWKDERRALEEGVRGMGGVSWLGFYRGEVVDPSYYVGAEALNVAVPAERKNELKA